MQLSLDPAPWTTAHYVDMQQCLATLALSPADHVLRNVGHRVEVLQQHRDEVCRLKRVADLVEVMAEQLSAFSCLLLTFLQEQLQAVPNSQSVASAVRCVGAPRDSCSVLSVASSEPVRGAAFSRGPPPCSSSGLQRSLQCTAPTRSLAADIPAPSGDHDAERAPVHGLSAVRGDVGPAPRRELHSQIFWRPWLEPSQRGLPQATVISDIASPPRPLSVDSGFSEPPSDDGALLSGRSAVMFLPGVDHAGQPPHGWQDFPGLRDNIAGRSPFEPGEGATAPTSCRLPTQGPGCFSLWQGPPWPDPAEARCKHPVGGPWFPVPPWSCPPSVPPETTTDLS